MVSYNGENGPNHRRRMRFVQSFRTPDNVVWSDRQVGVPGAMSAVCDCILFLPKSHVQTSNVSRLRRLNFRRLIMLSQIVITPLCLIANTDSSSGAPSLLPSVGGEKRSSLFLVGYVVNAHSAVHQCGGMSASCTAGAGPAAGAMYGHILRRDAISSCKSAICASLFA